MTTKYGMFLEHTYLKPGDLSGKAEGPEVTREGGLNLKATAPRTGKNNDATFDKFVSLHESDRYVDPARRQLLENRERKKHNVVELPFKSTSPMKKSSGVGDYYGVLEGKVPAGQPLDSRHSLKKGDVQPQPRGMYTSPSKKGTYGMNKTTLSERQGVKGIATEYEYQHDPDSLHDQQRHDQRIADHKARVTELPFKPCNPPARGGAGIPNLTISKGKGVANEYEYILGADPAYAKPVAGSLEEAAAATAAGAAHASSPFKPASSHLSGDKWPEYVHDPEGPKLKAEAERKRRETARLAASGPWKPNRGPKSDMCRSIMRMNI